MSLVILNIPINAYQEKVNIMFSSIIDLVKKAPLTSFVLFYGFIPTIFLGLTIIFIMLHIGAICPTTILDLLFDDSESSYYKITFQFIDVGQDFIGSFIDIMFNLLDKTLDALLGDDRDFLNSFDFNNNDCPDIEFPIEPLEDLKNTETETTK